MSPIFEIILTSLLGIMTALVGYFIRLVMRIDKRLAKVETFLSLWVQVNQKQQVTFEPADKGD